MYRNYFILFITLLHLNSFGQALVYPLKYGENIVTYGSSVVTDVAQIYDTATTAFITAVESTGVTLSDSQKIAVDSLVIRLKALDMWNDADAIYPVVGGTANAHKYNLKDTGLYQLNYVNNPTHSTNGILFSNGVADYAIPSSYNPSTAWGSTITLMVYDRTNKDGNKNVSPITSNNTNLLLLIFSITESGIWRFGNATAGQGQLSSSTGLSFTGGVMTVAKNTSGRRIIFNATTVATNAVTTNYGTYPTEIHLARNDAAQDTWQCAGFYIGTKGLADADIVAWNTLWQRFEIMLNRQVP